MTTTCDTVRTELLEEADLAAVRGVYAAHLGQCAECAALAAKIARLELTVKAMPTPAEALNGRAAFIDAHTVHARATSTRRRVLAWSIATAAALLIGISTLMLMPSAPVAAAPSTIEKLIDWNVKLGEADLAERESIYRASAEPLRTDSQALAESERGLAERLLAHGAWLVENDDPLDEAERFQEIAERMAETFEATGANGYAKLYTHVMQHGVKASLKKAQLKKDKRSDRREQRLTHLEKRSKQAAARMEKLNAAGGRKK
jgi:hypothetical protein